MELPSEEVFRNLLYLILFFAVLFGVAMVYLPTVQTGDHPPQVSIERTNPSTFIQIVWEGGTDDAFVGNFSVTVENVTTYYPKPKLYQSVATIFHPDYVCINVSAIDNAVRVYRAIGYRCL